MQAIADPNNSVNLVMPAAAVISALIAGLVSLGVSAYTSNKLMEKDDRKLNIETNLQYLTRKVNLLEKQKERWIEFNKHTASSGKYSTKKKQDMNEKFAESILSVFDFAIDMLNSTDHYLGDDTREKLKEKEKSIARSITLCKCIHENHLELPEGYNGSKEEFFQENNRISDIVGFSSEVFETIISELNQSTKTIEQIFEKTSNNNKLIN